jgi:putative permease
MNKVAIWGVVLLVLMSAVYLVSDTLAPFLIAFIFAYLLQPVIETNCKRFALPRGIITFLVFVLFIGIVTMLVVLVVPVIYQQIAVFVAKIPQYKSNFETVILSWSGSLNKIDPNIADKVSKFIQNFIDSIFSVFASFVNHIWQYTLATINFVAITALVPIILYYFLRDWPQMTKGMESVLPIHGKSKVRKILNSINELLSAYIRGQLNICLLLMIYYVTGLHIIGLDLALLLGILSGFMIIIPFIGIFISFSLAMISCYFNFGAEIELLYVFLLYGFGHVLEAYILSPKIIGNRIGLHPLWIIFAVFAAGSLFGFLGVLFAIPIAGITKVFVGQMIDYYKSSDLYKK